MTTKCVIGEPCSVHGFFHGAEAEELRDELEKLIDRGKIRTRDIRRLLDRVDARDSAAWAEFRARLDAPAPVDTNLVCKRGRCACATSEDECCCIPNVDDARARCTQCSAKLVLIDINTGFRVDLESPETPERQ